MAVRECKNFKIYLFFKHKETAEKWLRCHGVEMEFTNSPAKMYGEILIPYDVDDSGDVVYKYCGKR